MSKAATINFCWSQQFAPRATAAPYPSCCAEAATRSGCDSMGKWPEASDCVVAPSLWAKARCSSGLTIRSSSATRYQLGLVYQADAVTGWPEEAAANGCWTANKVRRSAAVTLGPKSSSMPR